jgi:hypothetical protein
VVVDTGSNDQPANVGRRVPIDEYSGYVYQVGTAKTFYVTPFSYIPVDKIRVANNNGVAFDRDLADIPPVYIFTFVVRENPLT